MLFLAKLADNKDKKSLSSITPNTQQIIIITVISALLAGIFYFYRTNYLSLTPISNNLFRALRMTCVYIFLPFGWALGLKKFKLSDFGISRKKLTISIILGIGVYSIALIVFLLSLGNPDFDNHFRWGTEYSVTEWVLVLALVSWMAFITDLWTRGFVLMLLAKHQSPWFGIFGQNVTWLVIHLYEVVLLGPSIGIFGALVLTIGLGVLGDVVALKTKNILGLGVGHVFLNITFFSYLRFLG